VTNSQNKNRRRNVQVYYGDTTRSKTVSVESKTKLSLPLIVRQRCGKIDFSALYQIGMTRYD